MNTTFNMPLLYQIVHDDETRIIIDKIASRKRSYFVRGAIITFAEKLGFEMPDKKPIYMSDKKWQEMQSLQEKSRSVDYTYVVAYYWLKSLPQFSFLQKSEIVRQAIKAYYQ